MSKSVNNELQQKLQRLLNDLQLEDAPAGGSVVVYPVSYTHLTLPTLYSV